jgi:hypothetical protein
LAKIKIEMSSHHFVKEGQEPALLIFDPIGLNEIEPLLEWAPLVVVAAPALERVLTWGIKIDAVVDKNVNTLKMVLAHQTPVRLIEMKQDYLTTSLEFLIEVKQFNVCVSCRQPESLIPLLADFHSRMEISLLSFNEKWSFIRSKKYSKWLMKNASLKIFAVRPVLLNGQPLSGNMISVNEDGKVELSADTPFWVVETV